MTADVAWRNRIVGSEQIDPGQLLANPQNWRTHPGALERWQAFTGREAVRG